MSMNLCYMSGYGVEIDDLLPFLNEKTLEMFQDKEESVFETFDELIYKDKYISCFSSDDGQFLYIADRSPYDPLFTDIDHINEHFYKALKRYLKNEVTKESLDKVLDDVFSYDFC